jgi:branched-chain amino acid transport system permease protein
MDYLIHILTFVSIYVILALSLNLVVGYTGLLSIAQAGFFCIGAYTTAILVTMFHFNFFLTLPCALLISALVAFLLGLVLSKFRDDYYMLATMGFTVIVYEIVVNWASLTGGPLGIPAISRPTFFGIQTISGPAFLILTLVIASLVYLTSRFIVKSSFGRTLQAIREDEDALQLFGYKTYSYKLIIFSIAAGLAAIAGSLYASYISFIDPSTFTINESVFILAMIILGGLGSLRGSIIGAVILVLLPEMLRFLGFPDSISAYMRELLYGAVIVFLMMYRPKGIAGKYKL